MTPKPQTVLLAADFEPMEDADESGVRRDSRLGTP